jgi:uncharacterized protein (DUF983 family)
MRSQNIPKTGSSDTRWMRYFITFIQMVMSGSVFFAVVSNLQLWQHLLIIGFWLPLTVCTAAAGRYLSLQEASDDHQ